MWKQEYIKRMSKAFPTRAYENWSTCQKLFPHVEAAVALRTADDGSLKEWVYILTHAAWYVWAQGKYVATERMARKAVATGQDLLGMEHLDVLVSLGILALVLRFQGKYKQAEEMSRRALAECEKALGKEHPSMLTSISNLALVLRSQGKY
jgi:hypothetical protein